ncbi:MAG: gliding motility-associated C-terminal domain-containing protein [Flavobacteriales bacterium]
MKKIVTFFAIAGCFAAHAQLNVDAGQDQFFCQSQAVTLTATAPSIPSTASYSVESIAWAPQAIGGTVINMADDAVSLAQPIGFSFCFLGNSYTQFYIGSNGWLSFSPGQPTAYTSATVPSTNFNVPKNCIMGPWQDWHPGISPGNYIKYQTIGTAPFRRLVLTWENIPMFQCTSTFGTFQIVLYETTNVIENHIFNKAFCSWAGGTATQAIHNSTGTVAFVVPGRNSSTWTATNESWRYTPNGPPAQVTWTAGGNPVGTGNTITVTPTQTTTYTAALSQCGITVLPDQVTVTVAPAVTLTNVTIQDASCSTPNGSITVNLPPNSPGPLSFQWNNPAASTTQNISGLAGGAYTLVVTNLSNQCTYQQTYIVGATSTLQLSAATQAASCANNPSGSATVTATSQFPGFTYQWNDPQQQTSATATGLEGGTYSVTVTDGDGCVETLNVFVPEPPPIQVSFPLVSQVSCAGANDGSAVALASGGTPGYSFGWSNGVQSNAADNLAPGTYTVTVTDANNCQGTQNLTITEPQAITVTFTVSDVACSGGSDGQVQAAASGGAGNYSFSWPGLGQQGSVVSNLAAGSYEVIATDANNCSQSAIAQVGSAAALNIQQAVSGISCFGQANASISLSVTGGTPDYTYTWDDPQQQTTPTISNLPAGVYTVVVTDTEGCAGELSVEITQPALLSAAVQSANDVLCFGQASGQVNLAVNGGTPGYSYTYNGVNASNPANNLAAGNYAIVVTDANGCSTSSSAQIDQPTALTASVSSVNPTCFGGTNGSATATANGGAGGYSYSWNGGAITTATASNLASGSYIVTVTDANGCTVNSSVTLTQPSAVVVNVSSQPATCGLSDGAATAAASGGTGPYQYAWPSAGQTGPTASDIESGSYQVVVTDANGCTGQSTVIVGTTNYPVAEISANDTEGYSPLNVTFANLSDNAITYVWDFGDGTVITTNNLQSVNHVFTSAAEVEEFVVTITAINAGGCEDVFTFPILVYGIGQLSAPNVFTPNGDGKNDTFSFITLSIEDFECIIFNRWGQEVYRWTDPNRGWSGRDGNSNDCSEGTYWFVVKAKGYDGREFNTEGNITLLR